MHTALRALRDSGAHFVIATADKQPISRKWQKTRPDFSDVERRAEDGSLIGVIPASLRCFVVDIDKGGENGVEAVRRVLGKPVAVIATQRPGGFHVWYRAAAGDIGNRKWGLGDASGDIRGSRGFVILWDVAKLAHGLAQHFDHARAADPAELPKPATNGKHGPEAVRTAPVGTRNNTLYREEVKAAKDGTFDRDDFRKAALDAGLPIAGIEATLNSAVRAAEGVNGAKPEMLTVAAQLADTLKEQYAYSPARGWFWRRDGELWQHDEENLQLRRCVSDVLREARERNTIARGIRTLEVVKEMESLLVDFRLWDVDPKLLGTPDQRVLDLRNGDIRAATPDDRISRRLGFVPDTSREATRWLRFLDETVPVDDKAASIAFLQRWCGYTLTGYNREHKFLFLLGNGGNGKGTFRDVLAAVMGEYYRGLPTDAIFGRYPQHRQWMARLEGARCASVSEPSPGDRWRVGDLKDFTGGGKVTANFMRQNSIDFEPICKLMVLANDAPKLGSVDEAIRRRLILMPFTRTPVTPDPQLFEALRAEGPAILAWMVEGAAAYLRDGLGQIPGTAQAAASEYLAGEDEIGQIIEDVLEAGPYSVTNKVLMEAVDGWYEKNGGGRKPPSVRLVIKELVKRGFRRERSNGDRGISGLRVRQ